MKSTNILNAVGDNIPSCHATHIALVTNTLMIKVGGIIYIFHKHSFIERNSIIVCRYGVKLVNHTKYLQV